MKNNIFLLKYIYTYFVIGSDIMGNAESTNLVNNEKLKDAITLEDFISVSISDDKMEAYLNSIPIADTIEVNMDSIKNILTKNGIVYGIDESKIQELLDNADCSVSLRVAVGKKSVDGIDGYLTYHFNTNPVSKPILLQDGSVDFRNLNTVQNVDEGQLLVTYTPPVKGKDGCFVTGEIVPFKPGKEFHLPKGKRVRISEDGLQLLADRDGNVEIIDGKVCVSNVLDVSGNVDLTTGNVSFNGDVNIRGNVITGFSVTALGSITVDGYVEASTLKADGDIVLKNGIQGSGRGKIVAGGNISAKFIEMAEVYAKGIITTNAIMNSTVESESDIIVSGKRGYIVGGLTKALNKIQATGLGNMAEIPTILEIGFTEEGLKKMIMLEQEIERLSYELSEIEENMNSFKTNINKIDLMRQKIEKTAKYTSSVKEYKRLKDIKEKAGTPRVDIEKTINVGSVLYIKSDIYKVKSTINSTSFRFGSTNRIVTISYNKD